MLHANFRGMFLVLVLALVFITACSKDSNNPVDPGNGGNGAVNTQVKVKIDGGGFNNEEITLTNGYSSFVAAEGETYAAFWGKAGSDSVYVAFQFAGSSKGSFDWRMENYDAAVIMMNDDNAIMYLATSEGKTNVRNYGAVGEKIEGTISGKMIEVSTMEEISVNGSFSIVRAPDSE